MTEILKSFGIQTGYILLPKEEAKCLDDEEAKCLSDKEEKCLYEEKYNEKAKCLFGTIIDPKNRYWYGYRPITFKDGPYKNKPIMALIIEKKKKPKFFFDDDDFKILYFDSKETMKKYVQILNNPEHEDIFQKKNFWYSNFCPF